MDVALEEPFGTGRLGGAVLDPVNRCVVIAAVAHDGQRDKRGEPYILHPLRLAVAAARMGLGEDAVCAAVLHDTLEDTEVDEAQLRRFAVSDGALKVLDFLTRREGEKYRDFVDRIAGNRLATEVKLLDLEDNTDPRRALDNEAYREMVKKRYLPAIERLKAARAAHAAEKVYG